MRAAGSLLESLQRQSAPKTIDYGALHSELHKAGWQSARCHKQQWLLGCREKPAENPVD